MCNFVNDNTFYSCNKELGTVISNVEYDMTNILSWLRYNSLMDNPGKLCLWFSDDKCFILEINANDVTNIIKES